MSDLRKQLPRKVIASPNPISIVDEDKLEDKCSALQGALRELEETLKVAYTRFTHERGEPDPTPPVPFEVVFSLQDWRRVETALASATALLEGK